VEAGKKGKKATHVELISVYLGRRRVPYGLCSATNHSEQKHSFVLFLAAESDVSSPHLLALRRKDDSFTASVAYVTELFL
jgi:hypothetical protein